MRVKKHAEIEKNTPKPKKLTGEKTKSLGQELKISPKNSIIKVPGTGAVDENDRGD